MPAGATRVEGLPSARYPLSKTGGLSWALGVRLPLLPLTFRRGRAGKTRDCYSRERRFEPCRRSLARPRGRSGDDAGPSTRKLRVRIPPGVLVSSGCGGAWPPRRRREPETAGSNPAGQMRGRGAAVLASLMSSRPWVRIPPALLRGRSSDGQSARLSGERLPVRVRSSPLMVAVV